MYVHAMCHAIRRSSSSDRFRVPDAKSSTAARLLFITETQCHQARIQDHSQMVSIMVLDPMTAGDTKPFSRQIHHRLADCAISKTGENGFDTQPRCSDP